MAFLDQLPKKHDRDVVEKHDSTFLSPMVMFKSSPYNTTFVDSRLVKIKAMPEQSLADTYTFLHRANDYGLIKTSDAMLHARMSIKTGAGAYGANTLQKTLQPFPLRTMWKSKEVYVNDVLVKNTINQEKYISYIRHLFTDDVAIQDRDQGEGAVFDTVTLIMGNLNTSGANGDSIAGIGNGTDCVNGGARVKQQLTTAPRGDFHVYDTVDTTLFNENGSDRYVPSDYDIKLVLNRDDKNQYLYGDATASAAMFLNIDDFTLILPLFKPNQQLSQAINEMMINEGKETKYYTTQYRITPRAIANGAQIIQENDLFNGLRPTRVYIVLMTQTRFNGGYEVNPFRFILPAFTYAAIRINNCIVQPEYRRQEDAYLELRKILNKTHRKMPFNWERYVDTFGILVFDLSENKDSFNEILTNATTGIINFKMTLSAPLTAAS